jgi:hypothetical protein
MFSSREIETVRKAAANHSGSQNSAPGERRFPRKIAAKGGEVLKKHLDFCARKNNDMRVQGSLKL